MAKKFLSKTKGTAAYKRRQARIAARKVKRQAAAGVNTPESPVPVPHLEPDQQAAVTDAWGGLKDQSVDVTQTWLDTISTDPEVRARIAEAAAAGSRHAGESAAARGLSAGGLVNAQLADVARARDLSTIQQNNVISRANVRHNAQMESLNSRLGLLKQRATGMKLGNLFADDELARAGLSQPADAAAPAPAPAAGPAAPQGVKKTSPYVIRPRPGKSAFLKPGQQLIGPKSRVPGIGNKNAGAKPIRVGIGGDRRYTISPTPGGRIKVTRRVAPSRKVRR